MNASPAIRTQGPVLLFGGPYSNLQATSAVLAEAARLGIPSHSVICTGDLVAYCADPIATIKLLRDAGIWVVMGNCDEQLGAGGADCGCGFAPGSACDRLSASWFTYAAARLGAEDCEWLAQLPRRLILEIGHLRLAVIHGSVDVINRFIFASTPASTKSQDIALTGCDGIIAGHCGLPFTQVINGLLWHNPGVIGLPANDGTARVWYSVLTPGAGGLAIDHRAFDYDHNGAADAMLREGLPPDYRVALETGLWPSCDVLPAAELHDRGVPLKPSTTIWRPTQSLDP
jgi:predicted phosphodiesterase